MRDITSLVFKLYPDWYRGYSYYCDGNTIYPMLDNIYLDKSIPACDDNGVDVRQIILFYAQLDEIVNSPEKNY